MIAVGKRTKSWERHFLLPRTLRSMTRSLPLSVLTLSPASRALFLIGVMIPGLRSLRSLTRGYQYAAPSAYLASLPKVKQKITRIINLLINSRRRCY
jgi:hypothetical protein